MTRSLFSVFTFAAFVAAVTACSEPIDTNVAAPVLEGQSVEVSEVQLDDAVTLEFALADQRFIASLHRANGLVSEDLRHLRWEDGALVEMPGAVERARCFYTGDVRRAGAGARGEDWMAVDLCADGAFEGMLVIDGQSWRVAANEAGAAHVFPIESAEGRCGVEDGPAFFPEGAPFVEVDTGGVADKADDLGDEMEVTLVTDPRYDGDFDEVLYASLIALAAYERSPYPRRTVPRVVSVVELDSEPYSVLAVAGVVRSSNLLGAFSRWAESSLAETGADQFTLLSGYDFFGSTIGLANTGTLCDEGRAAVVMANRSPEAYGITYAHELGHNVGMYHDSDGNSCPSSGFVMEAIISSTPPSVFSSCSIDYYESWYPSAPVGCFERQGVRDPALATCGDGIVDPGEVCDCGPLGCDGVDPCCNGETCQPAAGATCTAADACCDSGTCRPVPASAERVCRDSTGACDSAEVCSGAAQCPADRGIVNGDACEGGICLVGNCEPIDDLCAANGLVADERCEEFTDCSALVCFDPDSGFCETLDASAAPDGLPCEGGFCVSGVCEPADSLPGVDGCFDQSTDSDGDGTPDCVDGCPDIASETEPGECGCGVAETDTDSDGAPDCVDSCADDPDKVAEGACGCGSPDTDTDDDGTADCNDACPADPNKTEPERCGCGTPESETCGDDPVGETDAGGGGGEPDGGSSNDGGSAGGGEGTSGSASGSAKSGCAAVPSAGSALMWLLVLGLRRRSPWQRSQTRH